MGRPRKPTWLHELEGTYRADRHGPRTNARATFPLMVAPPTNRIPFIEDDMDEQIVHKGIDVLPDERLLVSAATLEWTLDATAKTIRRWAEQGLMPRPYKVGKSLRWDAAELRQWIDGGCEPVAQ